MSARRLRAVVVAGPGRSGVSTTAFAIGCALAREGRRVALVLVDPLPTLAEELDSFPGASAERLDVAGTFERLVRRAAGHPDPAEALLSNPLYGTLTASLPGATDFTLLERVLQLGAEYDVVVADSPPSNPAGEFVTAPARVEEFLGHPLYRALSVGQRAFGKVADAALSSFLGEVRDVAGPHVADSTTAFFRAFSALEHGLRERLGEVATMLAAAETRFVVVAEPRPEAVAECAPLTQELAAVGATVAGLVVNRSTDPDHDRDLTRLVGAGEPLRLPDLGPGPVDAGRLASLLAPVVSAAPRSG